MPRELMRLPEGWQSRNIKELRKLRTTLVMHSTSMPDEQYNRQWAIIAELDSELAERGGED
jgi:hypothetical protein